MAIKGSLKEASLPDVLQLLALGQKTGCLSIADRSNFGYIYFDKGRICYASIVNRRDRLGDILVKHQKITSDQLDAAIHRQSKERDKKLGEILVGMGVISQEDLERYMRVQIEESVYYLFTWTQGTFNFESEVRPERQDFLVNINPESLLLEGARRVDEWSLIEKKIPSFDLIFTVDKDRLAISEATPTAPQQRLWPLRDASRDVNQVIEDSGLGEFEIGKALYGLIPAGFVHRAGRTASAADAQITDARVEEHRNLGIAFYKAGMLDEATREFRRVAELRSGEANAHFYIGLVALKQARWREAMDALRLAAEKGGSRPAVFHNLGFAYEQLGRLEEAEAAYGEAASRARTDAKVHLGWGVVALKRGDYAAAAGRLDRARELFGKVPPPAWFWARTLCAAGAGEFELAEQLAEEGGEAFPSHAALQNNLAVLKELAGDLAGAEDVVRAARKNEPSLPQLSKNLGDLAYRASRYDEAWEAYRRAVELAPDLGDDVYFKLGNIAYKRNERDLAAQMWRQALEINPKHELVKANVDTLRALAPRLDTLWVARRGEVRVWSAGCASGEEPYTVAVALAEAARRAGQEPLLARARVDATDIDRASLERTRAAQYPEAAFSETPPELVARYFTGAPRQPAPELRRIVHVAKHDLTSQPAPAPPYDLVACRNVVIYFDRAMQERLFTLFADALAPGGVLLLGKVETLFGPARERLVLEEPRERIYRLAAS